ncbi:excisionase family DNA-binding protein [Arthrobacter sp. LAPM80]|uniref:excisionase family DNA-binding protein n=1 Tax=Arthrobacter sp. LAPM80 TaxID=3141788 RepID=UPI00398B215D
MVYPIDRPLLGTHVSGVTAQWISARLSVSEVDDACRYFSMNGRSDLAGELSRSMAGVRAAAALYISRREEAASAVGSSELPISAASGESSQDHLSVTEAAGVLGLSDRRVRQILAAGTLRGARQGHRWLIGSDDLDGYRMSRVA